MALPKSLVALDGKFVFIPASVDTDTFPLETCRILQPGGRIAFSTWVERR